MGACGANGKNRLPTAFVGAEDEAGLPGGVLPGCRRCWRKRIRPSRPRTSGDPPPSVATVSGGEGGTNGHSLAHRPCEAWMKWKGGCPLVGENFVGGMTEMDAAPLGPFQVFLRWDRRPAGLLVLTGETPVPPSGTLFLDGSLSLRDKHMLGLYRPAALGRGACVRRWPKILRESHARPEVLPAAILLRPDLPCWPLARPLSDSRQRRFPRSPMTSHQASRACCCGRAVR